MQAIPACIDPSRELRPSSAFAPVRAYESPFASGDDARVEAPEPLVDEGEADAIELSVLWGDAVLHVAHLAPPRSFYVGEDAELPCDLLVPQSVLGASRVPVVLVDDGVAYLVVTAGAEGTVTLAGQPARPIADAIASGLAQPWNELAGAHRIALRGNARAKLTIGTFTFVARGVRAARLVAGRARLDRRAIWFQSLSLAAHAAILGVTAVFMPPLAMADDDAAETQQIYTLRQTIDTIAERERDASALTDAPPAKDPGAPGGEGARSALEEGSMGSQTSTAKNHRWGIAGSSNEVRLPNRNAVEDARTFGMIGILNALSGADPNTPTARWGGEEAVGRDPLSAKGNLWGPDIGEAAGAGGLGLTGIGEGGGGFGEGIGLGTLGIGHGGCTSLPCGVGEGFGPGHGGGIAGGHGLLPSGHKPNADVRMRQAGMSTSGHLPPEIIQRIVRQNFGRFRLCYENGLRAQPSLQGRVAVRFVIGHDGSVSNASGGGDLPDSGVVSCVARAFYGLSFPQPDGGIVTVVYPIMFSPGS